MQPAAQGVAGADRAGLPGQHQEGGLEGVLDVVLVLQDGAAGGQDHRTVPRHQGLEGRPRRARRHTGPGAGRRRARRPCRRGTGRGGAARSPPARRLPWMPSSPNPRPRRAGFVVADLLDTDKRGGPARVSRLSGKKAGDRRGLRSGKDRPHRARRTCGPDVFRATRRVRRSVGLNLINIPLDERGESLGVFEVEFGEAAGATDPGQQTVRGRPSEDPASGLRYAKPETGTAEKLSTFETIGTSERISVDTHLEHVMPIDLAPTAGGIARGPARRV